MSLKRTSADKKAARDLLIDIATGAIVALLLVASVLLMAII